MSLRAADIRFLLPKAPASCFVSPGLTEVAEGLEQAHVALAEAGPDVAVATASGAPKALGTGADQVIVIGRSGRRALRGKTPSLRRFLALPEAREAHLILPADRPQVALYAVETWTAAESRLRLLRNRAAARLMALGRFPDLRRSITLGIPSHRPPFVVAAAARFGVPADADWFLTLGLGDALTRAVFHLFAPQEAEPRWALKFSRVAGYLEPFERDERGLAIAAAAGGAVASHAPRLLGRFEAAGLPASLEQAAAGRRLTYLLQAPGRRHQKVRLIDTVAEWIVELARQTAAPASALAEERRRLQIEVMPAWGQAGVPADLLAHVPEIPAVLQHNDLGCWNLIVHRGSFTAVDWESARAHGFPLWDLLYFLVDALVHLDRAWSVDVRRPHAARLLCGQAQSSSILFRWLRVAVEALAIPPGAVGTVATLGWLHHGLSPLTRAAAVQSLAPGQLAGGTYAEWMVATWLTTPGLGPEWSAWMD